MAGRNSTSQNFYVYVHRRATDGRVFYVGKGKDRRAFSKRRNQHWNRVVEKYGYTNEFVKREMYEYDAIQLECDLIDFYGIKNLCNLTLGGEGLSGHVFSESHRKKIGDAHRGKKKPEHVIYALKIANLGRPFTEEHREKLSIAGKYRTKSQEHINKVASARIGKHHTLSGKKNIRKAKCKTVVCVQTGELFDGTHHATEWVKTFNPKASQAAIARACNKPSKIAYGFNWKYEK